MVRWEKQKKIKSLYELYAKPVREKYGLTQMEYTILLFLHRNPADDTASAIVETGRYTKSHVSSSVKKLESRNLIIREYRDNNNKTIHLKLTDQAGDILKEAEEAVELYMRRLFAGFSQEEFRQMGIFFEKACRNAEEELKSREEENKNA